MIAVTGYNTTIVSELMRMVDEPVQRINLDLSDPGCPVGTVVKCDRYVLAAGVLHQKRTLKQSPSEIVRSLSVNLVNVIRLCERILTTNDHARICVIGSESAERGSFDQTYAAAKAGVHAYVNARKVLPAQQLCAVAPPIISDSGMTRRRHDYPGVLETRRTVTAADVARAVHHLLFGPIKNGVLR